MFWFKNRKKYRSARMFPEMLAEEILRAEMRRLYGDGILFFQVDITAEPERLLKPQELEITDEEEEWASAVKRPVSYAKCRIVNLIAIFGPFERLYPENPPEDKRCRLRRVVASVRVYSIETGCTLWKPHRFRFEVFNEFGTPIDCNRRFYERGTDHNGARAEKDADNPCETMVASQTPVNYPGFHPNLFGK